MRPALFTTLFALSCLWHSACDSTKNDAGTPGADADTDSDSDSTGDTRGGTGADTDTYDCDTPHPNQVWFDDVVVSTEPIGCE